MLPAISSYWSGEKPAEMKSETSSPGYGEAEMPCQDGHPAERLELRIGELGISPTDEPVPEAAQAAGGADRPQPVDPGQAG